MEEWRRCIDNNIYEISSEGRVKNRRTGRILKTHVNPNGYECIQLYYDDRSHIQRVHRLVAEAYHGGKHDELDVNHIDGNKLNNSANNLEWCSRSENIRHAFNTGLKNSNHRKRRVRIIENNKEFESLTDCAKFLGCDRTDVAACLNGRQNTCRGYRLERLD